MEFETGFDKLIKKDYQKVRKYTTIRIRKDTKDLIKQEMGVRPQQALEMALYWHREGWKILESMAREIKKLSDKIDELESIIIGKSDQRGYM